MMIDNFVVRAFVGGIGIALAAGPLGCFVIWRRMAYFGDTLSHAALLGIALAVLFNVNMGVGVLTMCLLVALTLVLLQQQRALASDTLLGIIAHSTLAGGMVVISFIEGVRFDLLGLLFGDILAMSWQDITWIYVTVLAVLGLLIINWRALLAITLHEELAHVEGVPVVRVHLILMMLIALVIAIAMKIVGILLITALLIIPAATARKFANTPEQMAIYSSLSGVLAVSGGVLVSLNWDIPTGPAIVIVAAAMFVVAFSLPTRRN